MLLRDVAVFPETIFGPSRNNAPQENPGSFVRVSFHPQRRITGLTYTMTICTSNEPTRVRSCFECNNVSTAVRRHCIALGSCDGGIPGVQNDDVCCHEGARRPRLDLGSQGAGCFGAIDAMIVLYNCHLPYYLYYYYCFLRGWRLIAACTPTRRSQTHARAM